MLAPVKFLARVLQHAPEPGRHTVRYYGLYAHACAEPLNAARALHAQAPVEPPAPIEWHAYLARFPHALPATRCPYCHATLVTVGSILPVPHAPP